LILSLLYREKTTVVDDNNFISANKKPTEVGFIKDCSERFPLNKSLRTRRYKRSVRLLVRERNNNTIINNLVEKNYIMPPT